MYNHLYDLMMDVYNAGGDDTIISARVLTAEHGWETLTHAQLMRALTMGAQFLHGSSVLFGEEYGWASVEGGSWVYHPPRPTH